MKKKMISIIVSAMLCVSLFPATAFGATATADFNGHRYQRIDQGMTWKEAKAYCESLGGYLATITSEKEQEVIEKLVSEGTQAQYWLGGTDEEKEGDWKWITGEEWNYWGTRITFNNYQNNEHYLQMERHHWGDHSKLGVWNDINNENYIKGEESFFSTENVGIICEFDIIGSSWAQTELQKADEMGLIPESLKGEDLTEDISRAEFAAVAVKTFEALSGTQAIPAVTNPFTDCKDMEVLKAYNIGAVNGTSDTTFMPDALLNREQAAAMLTRVFKKVSMPSWSLETDADFPLNYTKPAAFSDDTQISAYARDSVYFMVANNIINGVGGNKFAPKNTTTAEEAQGYANATREQALAIAVRMVENLS